MCTAAPEVLVQGPTCSEQALHAAASIPVDDVGTLPKDSLVRCLEHRRLLTLRFGVQSESSSSMVIVTVDDRQRLAPDPKHVLSSYRPVTTTSILRGHGKIFGSFGKVLRCWAV